MPHPFAAIFHISTRGCTADVCVWMSRWRWRSDFQFEEFELMIGWEFYPQRKERERDRESGLTLFYFYHLVDYIDRYE